MGCYVLDDNGKPRREEDVLVWARWFEQAKRHVGRDEVAGFLVSTVFLGVDHGFGMLNEDAEPVLWETMIFGAENLEDLFQWRYSSLEEAQAGHLKAVELLREHVTKIGTGR